MKVNIRELKCGFEKVLNNLLENEIEEVEIEVDYYWNIDELEKYDVEKDPKSLDIGQLSDDYIELQKIISGEVEPLPYSLKWLSSLARIIGEMKVV